MAADELSSLFRVGMQMDGLPSLEEALAALRSQLDNWSFDPRHYVSDRVLFDLAIDIAEHATVVHCLLGSPVARAGFANARAAFESAQDILYLTGDESEYDRLGCYARASEVIASEDLQRRFAAADLAASIAPVNVQSAEDTLLQDARDWDVAAPGMGLALRTAFEAVQASAAHQHHWSGLGRAGIASAVAAQLRAEDGHAEIHDAVYGALSIHAHAHPRLSARVVKEDDDGNQTITSRSEDADASAGIATLACISALAAFRRRVMFFGLA